MAMGHVTLKEFFVDRVTPYFDDYVKRYTDLPFLVSLEQHGETYVPGKFLTASDLGDTGEHADFKTVLLDAATGEPVVPNGSLGFRFGDEGVGKWNLDLGDTVPLLSAYGPGTDGLVESVPLELPRFDAPDGSADVVQRGVPVRHIGGHLVTTVYDLLLATYGVSREGLPGRWPTGYDDATQPCTPAWQETVTGVPAEKAERIGREFSANAEESRGRSMIIMGAGTNHWFHSDTIYRQLPHPHHAHRLPGRQRRWLGALRRAGEGPPADRVQPAGERAGLVASSPAHDPDGVLVPAHRPVPLRRVRGGHLGLGQCGRAARRQDDG